MEYWQNPCMTIGPTHNDPCLGKRENLLVQISGKPNDNRFQVWLDPGVQAVFPGPGSGTSFSVLQFHILYAGFIRRHLVLVMISWLLSASLTPSHVQRQKEKKRDCVFLVI